MNSTMEKVPVEKVQKFYENKGFVLTTNDESGDTHMEKNCSFTAKYFISDKGGNEATEPTWRTSPSGKEYCLLMGIAKISPQWIEKSWAMDKIITISEHSKNVFSSTSYEATNNDMGDLMNDEWTAFMAEEDLED